MPLYDYRCPICNHIEFDVFRNLSKLTDTELCPKCQQPMNRLFPKNTHVNFEGTFDGKNRTNIIQEKNEKLKKKHAGYSHEQQSIKEKVTKIAKEKGIL